MATRWFVFLAIILALTDQFTKWLARNLVDQEMLQEIIAGNASAPRNVIIPDFFRITLNFNEGIAWGMLPQWSEYFTYFAIIMVLVILMILRKLDRDEVWLKIALAFQMAGAIGNMTDRLRHHRVTDFIDVTLFPNTSWEYDWPIFNLADSFVVMGTIVLVLVLMLVRDRPPEESPAAMVTVELPGELSTFKDKGDEGWEEIERLPGSVSTEEALVEIPSESESEKLRPFEDDAGVAREELEEPLGSTSEELKKFTDETPPEENRDKLGELPGDSKPGS